MSKRQKFGDWALLRLLREAIPGNRLRLLWAFLCMAAVAVASAGIAWAMQDAINLVLVGREPAALLTLPAAIIAMTAIKGLADYGQAVAVARIGSSVAATLQQRLFRKVLSFEQDFFDHKRSGRLAAQVNNNVRAAKGGLMLLATTGGRDALTVLALGTVMVIHDPILALIALVAAPFVLFGLSIVGRRAKGLTQAEMQGGALTQALTQETFQGIRTVRAFTLEEPMTKQFEDAVRQVERRSNDVARISALSSPLSETAGGMIIAATILIVGFTDSGRSPGEVMSFITAFLLAFQPAKRLMNAQVALIRGATAAEKLYEMLDQPEAPPLAMPALLSGRLRGDIAFKDVLFAYNGHPPVLNGVSFEAGPGEMVALVGRSGAGKSTAFALLQKLYRPISGLIEIDGVDLALLPSPEFRRQLSVVSQNTTLFARSIRENIRLARPVSTDAEVAEACVQAGALEFIEALPAGFDTIVGEQGLTLSGGQVQRLSMARAILRDAPILLLDEPTAALDAETADLVQASVARFAKTRTVLTIAHRPALITAASRVVVLAGGRVVDAGSPGELLVRSKEYRGLIGSDPAGQSIRNADRKN